MSKICNNIMLILNFLVAEKLLKSGRKVAEKWSKSGRKVVEKWPKSGRNG